MTLSDPTPPRRRIDRLGIAGALAVVAIVASFGVIVWVVAADEEATTATTASPTTTSAGELPMWVEHPFRIGGPDGVDAAGSFVIDVEQVTTGLVRNPNHQLVTWCLGGSRWVGTVVLERGQLWDVVDVAGASDPTCIEAGR